MHGTFKAVETTGKRSARERPVHPNIGLEVKYRRRLE